MIALLPACLCGCGRPATGRGVSRTCAKRMAMGLQPDLRMESTRRPWRVEPANEMETA